MSLTLPENVPKTGFYYHYKHDPKGTIENYAYEFLYVAFHTEKARPGEEHFAVYRPLYIEALVYQASKKLGIPCVDNRPLEMWMSSVEVEGKTVPRFKLITNPVVIQHLEEIKAEMYP